MSDAQWGKTFAEIADAGGTLPCGGKPAFDLVCRRFVTVVGYGNDAAGRYVEVRLAGSYGARSRLPYTCIRTLTAEERAS